MSDSEEETDRVDVDADAQVLGSSAAHPETPFRIGRASSFWGEHQPSPIPIAEDLMHDDHVADSRIAGADGADGADGAGDAEEEAEEEAGGFPKDMDHIHGADVLGERERRGGGGGSVSSENASASSSRLNLKWSSVLNSETKNRGSRSSSRSSVGSGTDGRLTRMVIDENGVVEMAHGDDVLDRSRAKDRETGGVGALRSDGQEAEAAEKQRHAEEAESVAEEAAAAAAEMEGGTFDPLFQKRKKHVFVLSAAGKPIFTRYGDDSKLTAFFGVVQALISFVANGKDHDHLVSVQAGNHKIVFLIRGPIYLCCVSRGRESVLTLRTHLDLYYRQIVFILTLKGASGTLIKNPSYDLRSLLGGTEIVFHQLASWTGSNLALALGGVKCVDMPRQLRTRVGDVLEKDAQTQYTFFAMLMFGHEVIQIVRRKNRVVDPMDLALLTNFITANASSMHQSETWTPICLPRIDETKFVYAYISFLNEKLYLAIISPSPEDLNGLSAGRERIVQRFHENNGALISSIMHACTISGFSASVVPSIPMHSLLHFCYKSLLTAQVAYPAFERPYDTKPEQKRIINLYLQALENLRGTTSSKPCFYMRLDGGAEAVYVVLTKQFALCLLVDGLVNKTAVTNIAKAVTKFIKNRENSLFLVSSPTWG
eukprot:ANDGO_02147.mRNA.1 Vacuolar fusion protein MON1